MRVRVDLEAVAKVNFACHQNAYAVLHELTVANEDPQHAVSDLTVWLESDPGFLNPKSWRVDRIEPGESVPVKFKDVDLSGQFLLELAESVRGSLKVRIEHEGATVAEHKQPIEVLAANEWGGAGYMPELLAAFCMPNDSAVDRVLHDAANVLRRAGKPATIDGYQSGSRQRVWEIAGAIYAAVANLGITYAMPPRSFESDGQKIRLPSQILQGRVATCLDSALFLAAAFEQAGLNPIVVLIKEHAFVGVWLQPESLATIVNEEAEVVRKRCQLHELVLVESTCLTSHPSPPFSRAAEAALSHLGPDRDGEFIAAVDIDRARAHRISPLALRLERKGDASDETRAPQAELSLEAAPSLPDFDTPVEAETPTTPQGRVERWQRKLLDLSARNPLLNHRATKSSLTICCPDPGLLEDKLAEGKKISVAPVPRGSSREQDREIHQGRTGESIDEVYARDALEKRQVLVDLPKDELDKRLVEIYRKTQTALQEGGSNTLYLALGFLLWKRDEKDERRFRAPLILMPVTLQRQSVRSGVKMRQHDDEPRFNTTLLEMLKRDFGIDLQGLDGTLPEDQSGIDVGGIWDQVRRAVRDSAGFEVIEDVVLGHFSFAKYLMWKDLVDRTEDLRRHPVVLHLIDSPREVYASDLEFVNRDDIDRAFRPADFLTPLPADSSQMAVVASADRGKDFVVIGPPGTGKSQTISNLIAHLLGKGKSVLFVSEKTAALDVVYRRLEDLGLGRFCLELHSNKARKADVLSQLKDAWDTGVRHTEEEWSNRAGQLADLRDRLNTLVERLHRKRTNGLTVHYAMGVKVRDADLAARVELSWRSADQHTEQVLADLREAVRLLQVQARAVGEVSESPFLAVTHGDWSPAWERELLGCATRLAAAARDAGKSCTSLCSAIGIELPDQTLDRLDALGRLAATLTKAYRKQTSYALESDGLERIELLEKAVAHLKAYTAAQADLSCPYDPMAWRELDGEALLARWRGSTGKWFLSRIFEQRAIRKAMQRGGAKGAPNPPVDAEALARLRKEGEAIDDLDKKLKDLRTWKAHDSDPAEVNELRAIAAGLRASAGRLVDDPQELIAVRGKLRALVDEGNDLLAPDATVGREAASYLAASKKLAEACAAFEERAGKVLRDHLASENHALQALQDTAEAILSRHAELNHWCNWQRRRTEALALGLAPLVDGVESGLVPVEEIPETFEAAYCAWWSEQVLEHDDVLRAFSEVEHRAAITSFRDIDDAFLRATANHVAATLSAGLPIHDDVPRSSQWGVLRREITKKARHKPVRQLIGEAPEAITRLAPCMMMSPLSVAQYLSPEQSLFDVVIFDEASQITVWDAVGAIARGKQVIVAGDPKQMPPTNFFARAEDDADGDIDYEGDLESILDELRSSNVPELVLNLHYRSRRESLIAFSNDRYYDNGLVTFPAPVHPDKGVRLVRPEGFYDRGKSRTNEGEARAIVAEIERRLTSTDETIRNLTIGVVTFNSEQQSLIEDLLDAARSRRPELEWAFSEDKTEPVFVKNLETVQGDERDVILFSVTYGPDRTGSMSMNFGPLNREGGERRLNVAMTRARSEMMVFSTMDPDKIDLSRTGARAVADLKHFLEYAERGPSVLGSAVHGSLGDFESPFEAAVAAGLRERGWTVHPQVGVSAFRVDLGIVHPDSPGVYLAGVECDGAMYHSTKYARERDKIRQAVLERLGWTLFRVWSTDWWINKGSALDRLDNDIREHLESSRVHRGEQARSAGADAKFQPHEAYAKRSETPETLQTPDRNVDKSAPTARSFNESRASDLSGAESPGERVAPIRNAPGIGPDRDTYSKTQPYVRAALIIDTGAEGLGEINATRLVDPVVEVVAIESPVHIDDVIRRLTHAAGLQRAGARIQSNVKEAIRYASDQERIRCQGSFLWHPKPRELTVRDRSDFPPQEKRFERIAPEELAQALLESIQRNFSLATDEALGEAARDLGFQRVTAAMRERLQIELDSLVASRRLALSGDHVAIGDGGEGA